MLQFDRASTTRHVVDGNGDRNLVEITGTGSASPTPRANGQSGGGWRRGGNRDARVQ